jgi:hypothetical protein
MAQKEKLKQTRPRSINSNKQQQDDLHVLIYPLLAIYITFNFAFSRVIFQVKILFARIDLFFLQSINNILKIMVKVLRKVTCWV